MRYKDTEKQMNVKVLRGSEEADGVFQEFHASEAGGHSGNEKTIHAISSRYYWPAMSNDIEKWVSVIDILPHLISIAVAVLCI